MKRVLWIVIPKSGLCTFHERANFIVKPCYTRTGANENMDSNPVQARIGRIFLTMNYLVEAQGNQSRGRISGWARLIVRGLDPSVDRNFFLSA